MTTLLRIDASAQLEDRSLTRALTALFTREFLRADPQARVITRDVGKDPVPPIDHRFIHAAFTPPAAREPWMNDRLTLSDQLIDEVIEANVIVVGAPMYNYGMPSTLKAWIDHIARIGRTFSFDLSRGDYPIEPILEGKKLVILSARGEFGFGPGEVRGHMNALDTGITACAHYFGVSATDIETVTIEYQEFKDDRFTNSLAQANERTRKLAQAYSAAGSATSRMPAPAST